MAVEQSIQESTAPNESNKEMKSSLGKWSVSDMVADVDDDPPSGCECNICLDFVQDPVVTFCGHLYCWPCIYKWLHMESISADVSDEQPPRCPVCKTEISETTLVPLYGRGKIPDSPENKMSHCNPGIPPRPPAPTFWSLLPDSLTIHPLRSEHHPFHRYLSITQPYFSPHNSYPTSSILGHPLIIMVSAMIQGRGIGSSATSMYNISRSNYLAEDSSPRMRRHITQVDTSLFRISSFLFCCILLCLVFF
uniref:E3 ubiquitin-protein ligase RMA n=1 Tax=Kalanchoe fedtschenkoi TaxID=63787 RepID=A0A7N1A3D5_KALFE